MNVVLAFVGTSDNRGNLDLFVGCFLCYFFKIVFKFQKAIRPRVVKVYWQMYT